MYYRDTNNTNNNSIHIGVLLLRIIIGGIMLFNGISKLHDISFVKIQLFNHDLTSIWAYGAYIGEIVAPILLMLGYRTRFFAMIIALDCLVAIFLVHKSEIFVINPDTGAWAIETLALFLGGAICLCFTGGGKYVLSKKSKWD